MPHVLFPTAFGTCGVAWSDVGLTAFALPDENVDAVQTKLSGRATGPASAAAAEHATRASVEPVWLETLIGQVQAHFSGSLRERYDAPLDWSRVSEFQRGVYERTLAIRPGYKKSYGEIARLMGLGNEAARAVGVALGANPWPLIVPCHRVVSANDKMTGFSGPGGIRTKTRLLALEGAELLSE